jgi:hypothetical protein
MPRAPEERRQYARDIWNAVERIVEWAKEELLDYMKTRGLKAVPETARLVMPDWSLRPAQTETDDETEIDDERVPGHDPGMVLPIRDRAGEFQGVQITWLDGEEGEDGRLTRKRQENPQRQTYGLLKGNFIELAPLDYQSRLKVLLVGEGPETVRAAMELTGLPGIATGGKMESVLPPAADEYILLVDVDNDGGSRRAAGRLASTMIASSRRPAPIRKRPSWQLGRVPDLSPTVRLATPNRPEGGKSGYDWNDALLDAGGDEAKLAELARSIREAPTFYEVRNKEEKREPLLDSLAELKLNEGPAAYEDERRAAAEQLSWRTITLDAEVERRVNALKAEQIKTAEPTVTVEQLAESAREIIACEDVLDLFADECSRVLAGEDNLIQLLYLVGTSRLFERTMHAALKGPSAAGKSQTRKAVLEYFPPESVIQFTAISEKALLYYDGDFANKILSMAEASAVEDAKFQNYLLRELMSENKLIYRVPQKVGGEIRTITIEKNGPVAFIVTTTANTLDPENETRLLSLEIDDSEEQTQRVVEKVARLEGLNRRPSQDDLQAWHDYQRWLAAGELRVVVPFALTLSRLIKGTRSVRLRRDFSQLLLAIKAHALLHRESRARDQSGAIVATIKQDYKIVRSLMYDVLATAVELKVSERIVETVEAVKEIVADQPAGEDVSRKGATVRALADALKLDVQAARRRVQAAEEAGFIKNLEFKGRGHTARYVDTGEALRRASRVLPSPDELEAAWTDARASAPSGGDRARGSEGRK